MPGVGTETLIAKISNQLAVEENFLVLKKAFQRRIVKLLAQNYQPTAKLSVVIYPFSSISQARLNTKRQKMRLVK